MQETDSDDARPKHASANTSTPPASYNSVHIYIMTGRKSVALPHTRGRLLQGTLDAELRFAELI